MAPRVTLVTLLLLAAPLTGCLGGGGDDGQLETASNDDAFNTTSPDGRTLLAFEETNETEEGVGGVDHHHDYWQGRDRVLIFETDAFMQPMSVDPTSPRGPLEYEAVATFRPPQGTFIYEATERVEFTLTNPRRHVCEGEFTLGGFWVCTDTIDEYGLPEVPAQEDPNPPQGLILRYKHAATTQWIDAGPVNWDEPVLIQITNPIQTDMPHATSSVWEFQVVSPNAYDSTLVFTAKAEIVRGGEDIPLWPGHPNFYVESDSRKVLSSDWGACDGGLTGTGCVLAPQDTGQIHAQRLISYGTRTLYVWINITDAQYPNPATAPTNWFLWHRNATGRDNVTDVRDIENHPIDQMEHLWVIPVDDNGMDSPYADGSRWNFELGAATQAVLSCYGGCAEWTATYTIEVIATNRSLPLEEYDMYCLRDDYCPTPEDSGGEEVVAYRAGADGALRETRFTRA